MAVGQETADDGASWPERLWWTLVGCTLLNWSVALLGATTSFAWMGALVVLTGALGLLTILASWLPQARGGVLERQRWVLGWFAALVLVGTFVAWSFIQVRAAPGYGTDELAFDQYAGQLVVHGLNPYVHSMAPSFSQFRVSPDGYTYSLSGSPVTQLSYPALAFLLYVPLLALGWSSQLAVALNVAAWGLTVLLLFAALPTRVRPAALVLGSVAIYVSYAVGGITDVLFMPLLVGAAYRWDRFGESRITYAGPVLLGLAMAVKQTPWLLLPFLVCALAIDEHARAGAKAAFRRSARYVAVVAAAFLAPNLPFVFMSPNAWVKGVLTPITSHLVPAGQGAVALSLFLKVGGGSLAAFTAATVILALLLILIYVGTYPLLRMATFVLPALILFFASRSYGNYLVALIPAAVVGAVTIRPFSRQGETHPGRGRIRRSRRWLAAVSLGAALMTATVVYALADGQPLKVRVTGIRTTGQLATVEQISLYVANVSGGTVRPAFALEEGGGITTFWHVAQGPGSLLPDTSANYTIVSPNFPAQPSIAGGFSVVAFSRGPAAVSSTGPYEATALHVALTPIAINQAVRVGSSLIVRAALLDQLDRPIHRAGVPIYLGQIIYDQSGLELSEARINHEPPGQTPVMARTNNDGVAIFRIVGTQSSPDPIYFEANLVQKREFYPYGYSEILPIRFVSR